MSGMAARSWNSSTAKPMRPWRAARSPVSSMICGENAVEDSASAGPVRTADVCQLSPRTLASSADQADAVNPTCWPPSGKIAERIAHRRARPRLEADDEQGQDNAELGQLEKLTRSTDEKTWRKP